MFVEHYLQTWNATESARRAGYEGDENTLAVVGWENLRKPKIADLVSKRIKDVAMTSDEVLRRLAEMARGTLAPFMDEEGWFDLTTPEAIANRHLLKKSKIKRRTSTNPDDPWTETEIELELHDPQAALVHLGRHHKLFTDRTEHSGMPVNPTVVIMPSNSRESK